MTTTPPTSPPPDPAPRPRPLLRRRRLRLLAAVAMAAGAVALASPLSSSRPVSDDVAASGEGSAPDGAPTSPSSGESGATPVDPTATPSASRPPAPRLTVTGVTDGQLLSAAALGEGTTEGTTVRVATSEHWVGTLQVTLDGAPLTRADGRLARPVDGAVELTPDRLARLGDGEHTLRAVVGEGERTATRTVSFRLDATPPTVELPELVEATGYHDPLEVPLRVEGATTVTVSDGEVELGEDGRGAVRFTTTPSAVTVVARDEAGNSATVERPVVVHFPGGRAVHTTPSAWRYAPKREPVIEMLEAGLVDAVQMDVKDELGDVSWDTEIELADLAGAEDFNRRFDMAAAIETIHSHGARVIGRLVVYRDHRLAHWAWENGRHDMVIQATDGSPYAGRYGEYAFTNFANPEVQQYNLQIALEAAELGFDDVLYDYIRRPDGAIEDLVIPGLGDRTPEEAVVEVMAEAYPLLREQRVWVGASVFGIAIDRPTQMAQHVPSMVPHVDYIAPMVYPNHWNLGEYGVAIPEDAPYEIVERSLTLYRDELEGTGTALMPWLQDFGGYGEAEVRAQIDATEAVTGARSFLLWCSCATYTDSALDPIPAGTPEE